MTKIAENNGDNPVVAEKMTLWESWKHVDPACLKAIKGGNLNGKTDINPVWRMRALTELLGPCGFGWNIREVERWTNEIAGEIGAFVKVELRIKVNGEWSEPIEGVGGSKLCGKGRGDGLNDEAWKMATTDAISVACKSLGIAADVYTGQQSHADAAGPADYGTKYENRGQYEPRSDSRSGNTRPGGRAENRPVSSAPAGQYQAPPPCPPGYVQEQGPRKHQARVCEVVDINRGKAERLIQVLSTYDYDDPKQWAQGLAWLRNEVVLREGAEELIVQLAVERRQQYFQQQVDNSRGV
ncbi:MAG: hypothetical protein K6A62_04580 [Bacteroidales bacterium]|nr:hypothetical protein [Bacteroidales bacterium]